MTPEKKKAKSAAARNRFLIEKYGITSAQYDEMLAAQGGVCALCRNPDAKCRHNRLNVDHCHETGRVRGIICSGCNVAIAALGDNEAGLIRALTYIRGDLVAV